MLVILVWYGGGKGAMRVGRGAGEGGSGVTTFAEVLLAAVITETASAALQLNFLWATLIFARQHDTYYFYVCASCPVDLSRRMGKSADRISIWIVFGMNASYDFAQHYN